MTQVHKKYIQISDGITTSLLLCSMDGREQEPVIIIHSWEWNYYGCCYRK
jgi:hypothetical protein